jgi:hypothetical protein
MREKKPVKNKSVLTDSDVKLWPGCVLYGMIFEKARTEHVWAPRIDNKTVTLNLYAPF